MLFTARVEVPGFGEGRRSPSPRGSRSSSRLRCRSRSRGRRWSRRTTPIVEVVSARGQLHLVARRRPGERPEAAFEPSPQAICPPPDWETKPLPITCTWIVRVVVASGRPDAPPTNPRASRTAVSRTARRPISLAIAETEYAHSGMSVTIVAVLRWKRDGRYRGVGLCLVAVVCAILFGSLGSARAAAVLLVDDDGAQCPSAAYTDINTAIGAANPGDTIVVCPGTYGATRSTSASR